jgi:hypothetical protein
MNDDWRPTVGGEAQRGRVYGMEAVKVDGNGLFLN